MKELMKWQIRHFRSCPHLYYLRPFLVGLVLTPTFLLLGGWNSPTEAAVDLQLYLQSPTNKPKHLDELEQIDRIVRDELLGVGIPVVRLPERADPKDWAPSLWVGLLGPIRIQRGWRYWVASLPMNPKGDPTHQFTMDFASRIFNDPIGQSKIRTNGFPTNIDPQKLITAITSYQIDTVGALSQFVKILSRYGKLPPAEELDALDREYSSCSNVFLPRAIQPIGDR